MAATNDPLPTIDVFVDKFRHLTPEEQSALLNRLAEARKEKTVGEFYQAPKLLEDLAQKIREARDPDAPAVVRLPEPAVPLSLEELAGCWQSDDPEEQTDYDQMAEAILHARDFDRENATK